MLDSIKYNLVHLFDFNGRDARQTFWYYVLFLFIAYMVVGMVGGFFLIGRVMGPVIEAANAGASEQEMQARMGQLMGEMMGSFLWISMIVTAVMDFLLAASFVRRIHDSNSSGWWALAILAAQVGSTLAMIPMIDMMQDFMTQAMDPANMENPAKLQAMFAREVRVMPYGQLGWIPTIAVIVFGVLASTKGPNRYGDAPVRF